MNRRSLFPANRDFANEHHQMNDLFTEDLHLSTVTGTWHARLVIGGHSEQHDTGAVTEAGARDWCRSYRMQRERRGEPVVVTVKSDE